jgi:hypothetical protein
MPRRRVKCVPKSRLSWVLVQVRPVPGRVCKPLPIPSFCLPDRMRLAREAIGDTPSIIILAQRRGVGFSLGLPLGSLVDGSQVEARSQGVEVVVALDPLLIGRGSW